MTARLSRLSIELGRRSESRHGVTKKLELAVPIRLCLLLYRPHNSHASLKKEKGASKQFARREDTQRRNTLKGEEEEGHLCGAKITEPGQLRQFQDIAISY